ncbi:hypothetical protein T492DRAFT_879833 [Pavlovales sp. CCMP2436]|nr:hypothetical protein T492DRAFT_879833 [Pavlovales sp. CCMP2436]
MSADLSASAPGGWNPLAPLSGGAVGLVPSMIVVAVVLYPQLDALVQTALPAPGATAAEGTALGGALARFAQLLWLWIGHIRYELPCLFADTLGQIFHVFPKGYYEEVEPYTREAREKRNDQVLLRLQRIKTEAEKMRVEEIHPEVLRRLLARVERWQWRHARLSFIDNVITSDDGRKAKRRFGFLLRSTHAVLTKRLAEADAHWGTGEDEDIPPAVPARAGAGRAAATASSRSRARSSKAISKPRAVKMERPKKR